MTATSLSTPILFSVLTSSHDNNEDFVNQLRNHLIQIETNVQQTLNKIQQRKPYSSLSINTNQTDSQIQNQFYDILKDVAIKNNLPFDEPFFRQQFLEKHDSTPKVDILRAKSSIIIDTNDQHLSPVNNTRRSQFAPVLSSTPVHQLNSITPIPVDLSLATSSAVPVLTINSTHLSVAPPSAIVPQRAYLGRPPRIPRGGESVTRQKKNPSPINEQQEEIVVAKEIRISSKRRIKAKQEIIEDHIQVIIEQQNEILPEIVKEVQSTPLRGRKKKIIQEDIDLIPQLEPPPPPPSFPIAAESENEIIPKKTRGGRSKKKHEQEEKEVKPTRTASVRGRKKQEEKEDIPPLPPPPPTKKATRGKKLIEPVVNMEENLPPTKVRATPSRGKKKSPVEISEPIIPSTPKKTTTAKSKKRKDNDEINENPIDTIQPPSPKRRGGRNTKSKNSSPVEIIPTPPLIEQQQQPVSVRSSRRGKKEIDIPIEKQEDIVLNKKTRTGRGKKNPEPINTDIPITVVDVVMTSVTVSAPSSSSSTIDSLVAKPPRPPVVRKKKSLAMPSLPQTSPSTPPPATQRIQPTSPVNDKILLPLPFPKGTNRRRRLINSPKHNDENTLEILPSITRNPKRTGSNVTTTPKRVRRDNLITAIPSTPGKKRIRCTCQKRRNKTCDICAAAIDV